MKFIIDRFEGALVVVELADKTMLNLPRKLLPAEAREGDVLEICIDRNTTDSRKRRAEDRAKGLWK